MNTKLRSIVQNKSAELRHVHLLLMTNFQNRLSHHRHPQQVQDFPAPLALAHLNRQQIWSVR